MSVKTLRFGPLPSRLDEAGQTPPQHTWDKFIDIPPDTNLTIIALPGGAVVIDQKVTRSFSHDFDPGKYRYCMQKMIAGRGDNSPTRVVRAEGEFLIDVTEEQWNALADVSPKAARATQTSDGPMWICKVPGCSNKAGTRLAAFLHESRDHFNIDPIKNPERLAEVELAGIETAQVIRNRSRRKARGDDDLGAPSEVIS